MTNKYEVIHKSVTESTNSDAKALAPTTKGDVLIISDRQTAGRGRLGRSFVSERGGLYMSLLFKKRLQPTDALKITVYASLCVARVVERLTGLSPLIKWVNDVYVGEKKLCGILCEGIFDEKGDVSSAVVGIGLNVSGELDGTISSIATTLREHVEDPPDPVTLALAIADEMYLLSGADFSSVLAEYRRRSCVIGKKVRVIRVGREEYTATALDVDSDGALVLLLDSGDTERLNTGEVSVRPE